MLRLLDGLSVVFHSARGEPVGLHVELEGCSVEPAI